jgi:hypothetical protein
MPLDSFIISILTIPERKLGQLRVTVGDIPAPPDAEPASTATDEDLRPLRDALTRHVSRFLEKYVPEGFQIQHVARAEAPLRLADPQKEEHEQRTAPPAAPAAGQSLGQAGALAPPGKRHRRIGHPRGDASPH